VARKKHDATERLKELLDVLRTHLPGDLRPKLHGFAYRFTLYLPLLSEGDPVFTSEQCGLLGKLFHTRFEGFSASNVEGSPPWFGSWLPPGKTSPVVDRHQLFVV
jgi:hypothetical protein